MLTAHLGIVVLAALAATLTLALKLALYRHYSGDLDEPVYVLQAEALRSGHLTLSASAHGDFFRPWLVGEHDGRLFTKYLPGFAAVLALSLWLTGSVTPALPVIAAAWAVSVYALALELFGRRRLALLAAGMMVASPIFLVQSALVLTYGLSVAVLLGAVTLTLRAVRTGGTGPMLAAGALFGFDVLVRQFDVLLILVILAGYLVLNRPHRSLRPLRPLRPLRMAVAGIVGFAPFVVLMLVYDAAVTGSPLRMPLSATDPLDRFGFGVRRILPGQPVFPYGRRLALRALWLNLRNVPNWSFGGIVLVLLAAVGLAAAGCRRQKLLVTALGLAFPVGYLFFWGSALSALTNINGIGPHYYVPTFAALAILAAAGVDWILGLPVRVWSPTCAVLLVGAVALTAVTSVPKVKVQRFVNARYASITQLMRATPPRPPAVVLVDLPPPARASVGNPYGFLTNPPDLDAPVLYGTSQGEQDWRLPDIAPGRALYALRPQELQAEALFGKTGVLVPLRPLTARRLQVAVAVRPRPGTRCLVAYLRVGDEGRRVPLGCAVRPGVGYRHTFTLGPGGVGLPPPGTSTLLVAGAASTAPGVPEQRDEVRDSLGVVALPDGPSARLLLPGPSYRLIAFPAGSVWLAARTSPELSVEVTPG